MNKNKSLYEAPNTDLLVVRFEQNIMSPNQVRSNSSSSGYDSEFDLGEFGN